MKYMNAGKSLKTQNIIKKVLYHSSSGSTAARKTLHTKTALWYCHKQSRYDIVTRNHNFKSTAMQDIYRAPGFFDSTI